MKTEEQKLEEKINQIASTMEKAGVPEKYRDIIVKRFKDGNTDESGFRAEALDAITSADTIKRDFHKTQIGRHRANILRSFPNGPSEAKRARARKNRKR